MFMTGRSVILRRSPRALARRGELALRPSPPLRTIGAQLVGKDRGEQRTCLASGRGRGRARMAKDALLSFGDVC